MEVEKQGRKLKEEHNHNHLSGAYIRRLVKQLSSSKTKDHESKASCEHGYYSNCTILTTTSSTKLEEVGGNDDEHRQPIISQQQQPPKKQVRRRLHTSRPYQERLLNMAEARREIVTALKFHRAAQHKQHDHPKIIHDEQQLEKQKQKQKPPHEQPPPPQNHLSYSSTFPNLYYSPWPSSPPRNINDQNLVINAAASPLTPLPHQTLGLNLNFHDFNNINIKLEASSTTIFPSTLNYYSSSSIYSSSSSPISSSSSSSYVATPHEQPAGLLPIISSDEQGGGNGEDDRDRGLELVLHATLDDEEMENIRSIGEQHQMEWNDTLNLVTSAWWFKFFKKAEEDVDHHSHPFHDEAMEFPFPDWLSTANDSCVLQQQHFNDHYSHDYFQDPALACMEIGEIEEMDEEWLA